MVADWGEVAGGIALSLHRLRHLGGVAGEFEAAIVGRVGGRFAKWSGARFCLLPIVKL